MNFVGCTLCATYSCNQKERTMSTTSSISSNAYYTPTTNTIGTSQINTCPTYTTSTYTINSDYYNDSTNVIVKSDGLYVNGKKVITEDDLNKNKKENKKMDLKNLNFDFGPVTDQKIAACPFGIAVKNAATRQFCYYDPVKCEVIDCTPFSFDAHKFLYKLPVAVSAIAEGDVILHGETPVFVKGIEDNEGRIVVIDLSCSEEKYILPIKNMFGFNYVTKIVSLLDLKNCGASADSPFGNILPFLMMGDKELDPMMLLMMSRTGSMDLPNMTQNPLMLYLLTQERKDLLPLLMMMNQH